MQNIFVKNIASAMLYGLIVAYINYILLDSLISAIILFITMFFVILFLEIKDHKAEEKKDKGFALPYWKLSYRRRFFRTLWFVPILVAAIIFMFLLQAITLWEAISITVILTASFIGQIVYNYKKYKAERNHWHK